MDKQDRPQIAQELKRLRKSRKLTQAAFAELVGLSKSMIISLESGARNPSIVVLHQIAQATGTTLTMRLA